MHEGAQVVWASGVLVMESRSSSDCIPHFQLTLLLLLPSRNYDPRKEQRKGIGVLPEIAWGEEKDGLQAALTARLKQLGLLEFVENNTRD